MQIDDRLHGALAVTALRSDRSPGLIQFLPGGTVRAVPARRAMRVKLENIEMDAWFAAPGELKGPLWFGEMRRVDDAEILEAMTEMRMEPRLLLVVACSVTAILLVLLVSPAALGAFGGGAAMLLRLSVMLAGVGSAWGVTRLLRRRIRRSAEYDLRLDGLRLPWGGAGR